MRLLLTITLLSILGACCTQNDAIVVGGPNDELYTRQLVDKFEDGTPVESEEMTNYKNDRTLYLVREGHTKKGDCRISRTPVDLGESGYYVMLMKKSTDTCSGNGCSHCDFASGGGCVCVNSTNTCSHTISRNHLLLWR